MTVRCSIPKTRRRKYHFASPTAVRDPTPQRFPIPVRAVPSLIGADEYMELSMGRAKVGTEFLFDTFSSPISCRRSGGVQGIRVCD
jgi:hypothetical protein